MEPVWHVTTAGTPATRGAEGFVHASFGSQLAGTLALHFAAAERVVLLRLDPERLGARLVVEPSRDGQPFPHVYGEVRADDVVQRVELRRGADGRFDLSPLAPPRAARAERRP